MKKVNSHLILVIFCFLSACCGDCADVRTHNFYISNNTDSTIRVISNSFLGVDKILAPNSTFEKVDDDDGLDYSFSNLDSITIIVGTLKKTDFKSNSGDPVNIFNSYERQTIKTSNDRCCPSKLTKNKLTITQADINEAQ